MKYFKNIFSLLALYNLWSCSEIKAQEFCHCDTKGFTWSIPNTRADLFIDINGFKVMSLYFPEGNDNESSIFNYNITAAKDGWLQVVSPNSPASYWIRADMMAIKSNREDFILFDQPDEDGSNLYQSSKIEIMTIVSCKDKWLEVVLQTDDQTETKGWLRPEDQCPSFFAFCN